MAFQSFEDLDVWKKSCQLAVRIYDLLRDWNDFGLKDQMQRAAVSIASNIAEGSERGGRDFDRFLRIALGSAPELRTQIYIARRIGLFSDADMQPVISETKSISRMIAGLRRSLNTQN